jgi:hypothetical protein
MPNPSATARPTFLGPELVFVEARDLDGGPISWRRLPGFVLRHARTPLGRVRFQFPDGSAQEVEVETQRLPNGGHRHFFVVDGRRWRRLYLHPGSPRLVTRESLGLRYLSVSLGRDPPARLALREDRIRRTLDLGGPAVRPSGMPSRRWRALLERLGELPKGRGSSGQPVETARI